MVVDLQGRRMPRHSSPILEAQAFTIFDEARCRGADLQLRADAVGLLTLGPTTCKDKLMQAAGRLRKLGKGQTLRIVGTADVTAKISRVAGASRSSQDVLQWVMHNTVQATQHGVLEWSHQGLLFASTRGAPEHSLQPEVLNLDDMYASSRCRRPVAEVVADHRTRRLRGDLTAEMQQLMGSIVGCAERYGVDHMVVAQGALGEECERELEREEEQEEEVEREVPRVAAAQEQDWDYGKALAATSLENLVTRSRVQLLPLRALAQTLQPKGIHAVPWSQQVFCTRNFAVATERPPGGGALNEYLRAVDALLVLPAGTSASNMPMTVLLLSDCECNALLELLWSDRHASAQASAVARQQTPLLANLCYAYKALGASAAVGGSVPKRPARLAVGLGTGHAQLLAGLSGGTLMQQLVSLQLFNGGTTYVDAAGQSQAQWEALKELPQMRQLRALVQGRGAVAEALVGMRGKGVLLSRSQLELACDTDRHSDA